jgi:hypothetical protein
LTDEASIAALDPSNPRQSKPLLATYSRVLPVPQPTSKKLCGPQRPITASSNGTGWLEAIQSSLSSKQLFLKARM